MSRLKSGQFCYRDLQLEKGRGLGAGSTGSVHLVRWRELTCVAKVLHPPSPPSTAQQREREQERFLRDCEFLGKMKHPNIVQYLAIGVLSSTRERVLLMELLDESLTDFLSRHDRSIPLHIETDICHDVALALAYLHGNDIVHGNLSSNNVFVAGGRRSKVNDFGLSHLIEANGRLHLLPQNSRCHGYLPPEASTSPPGCSEKSDSFSCGVLTLQVMCRLNPDPTPPTKTVHSPESSNGTVSIPVIETERRQAHIDLVDPSHPLLPIALDCLSMSQRNRPTASELCSRLEAVKVGLAYKNSTGGERQQRERGAGEEREQFKESTQHVSRQVASKQEELRRLQQEVREKDAAVAKLQWQLQGERSETLVLRKQLSQQEENVKTCQVQMALVREEASKCLISMVEAQQHWRRSLEHVQQLERQVVAQSEEVEHLTQQLREEVEAHRGDMQELEDRLNSIILSLREQLRVATSGRQRAAARNTPLHKSISQPQIPSLFSSSPSPHAALSKTQSVDPSPVQAGPLAPFQTMPPATALVPPHSRNLAPQGTQRAPSMFHTGVSASHQHMCYFSSFLTNEILAYNTDNGQWQLLPKCPVSDFGLEVVNARVTIIGGRLATTHAHQENCTNQLLSLVRREGQGNGGRRGSGGREIEDAWREELPEMALARAQPATACNEHLLIVAGGEIGERRTFIADIEVLDLQTRVWSKVASSPLGSCHRLSAVVCHRKVYLVEARRGTEKDRIHALPLEEIQRSLQARGGKRTQSHGLPWKLLKNVPASNSTCTSVSGSLMAVGGIDGLGGSTNQIWAFNESSERWRLVGRMKTARYRSLVGVAHNSTLFVVGGLTKTGVTDKTEVFTTI